MTAWFERVGGTRTIRVDVRVITATNRHLADMVEQGLFREDLYYRLNVIAIEIPPLRERKDDIPVLARSFIRRFSGDLKKRIEGLDPQAEKTLVRYNWPGNIRELENTIERAVLLAEGPTIATDDLRIGELSTTTTAAREAVSTVRHSTYGLFRWSTSNAKRCKRRSGCRTGYRRTPPNSSRSAPA